MLVHRRVTPSIKFAGTHLYTWVKRGTVEVKCLAQEHNTMSPARARTQTACSRVKRTNHEATAPPTSTVLSDIFQKSNPTHVVYLHACSKTLRHGWTSPRQQRTRKWRVSHSAFTETGATQTMKTNQKAELKQQIPTFSNPTKQMPSTKEWNLNLFVDRWCLRDGVKLKPVVLSCAYGFRNNNMLHSVYFRQLVDLGNKSCVRVPLVNIYSCFDKGCPKIQLITKKNKTNYVKHINPLIL